jgi:MYXO-CTERM domain-containing protein
MRHIGSVICLCACALPASIAGASTIASVEGGASGALVEIGTAVDPSAVVTAVLSQPGTFNGKTYTNWSFLVNDGTGSLAGFGAIGSGYTPTVGDGIDLAGTYSPFHQIPEIGTITTATRVSSGNSVAAPSLSTIPTLNQATLPSNVATYLFELDNVTISGFSGTFGTTNLTGTITDGASNSMTLFYWPTSYSACNVNLFGTTVPSEPVNMIGFVSVFTSGSVSTPEFTPIMMTPTPGAASLLALGALPLARRRRSR